MQHILNCQLYMYISQPKTFCIIRYIHQGTVSRIKIITFKLLAHFGPNILLLLKKKLKSVTEKQVSKDRLVDAAGNKRDLT